MDSVEQGQGGDVALPDAVRDWLSGRVAAEALPAFARTWADIAGRFVELSEVDRDLAGRVATIVQAGDVDGGDALLTSEEAGRSPAEVSRLRLGRADLSLLRGDVREAVTRFNAAIEAFAGDNLADQARVRHLAAARLYNYGLQHDGAGMAEAVAFYRSNAGLFNPEKQPGAHALTHAGLGHALRSLGTAQDGEAGVALLGEAAQAYRAALKTAIGDEALATHRSLGMTLWQQAGRVDDVSGGELLAESVSAYRAAAGDGRRVSAPVDWALTQSNLGIALMDQAARSGPAGAGYLKESISAYRGALDVLNAPEHPVGHATVQGNLGRALQNLADGSDEEDARERLTGAVSAFRAALALRSRMTQPGPWAGTQLNLAMALEQLGDMGGADAGGCYDDAVSAYRLVLTEFTHGTAFDHATAAIARLAKKRAPTE